MSLCATGLGSDAGSATHQLVIETLILSLLHREMGRGREASFLRLQ